MAIKGCTVDLICRAGVQITSEGKKYTIRIAIRVGAVTGGHDSHETAGVRSTMFRLPWRLIH